MGQGSGLMGNEATGSSQPSGSQQPHQAQPAEVHPQVPEVPSLEEPAPPRLDRANAAVRRALSEGAGDDHLGTRRRTQLQPN